MAACTRHACAAAPSTRCRPCSPGRPSRARRSAVTMTLPPSCMCGPACASPWKTPIVLISSMRRRPSASIASSAPSSRSAMPAFKHDDVERPDRGHRLGRRPPATCRGIGDVAHHHPARRPASASGRAWRAMATTSAPASTNRRTTASPIPEVPPVTKARPCPRADARTSAIRSSMSEPSHTPEPARHDPAQRLGPEPTPQVKRPARRGPTRFQVLADRWQSDTALVKNRAWLVYLGARCGGYDRLLPRWARTASCST